MKKDIKNTTKFHCLKINSTDKSILGTKVVACKRLPILSSFEENFLIIHFSFLYVNHFPPSHHYNKCFCHQEDSTLPLIFLHSFPACQSFNVLSNSFSLFLSKNALPCSYFSLGCYR